MIIRFAGLAAVLCVEEHLVGLAWGLSAADVGKLRVMMDSGAHPLAQAVGKAHHGAAGTGAGAIEGT